MFDIRTDEPDSGSLERRSGSRLSIVTKREDVVRCEHAKSTAGPTGRGRDQRAPLDSNGDRASSAETGTGQQCSQPVQMPLFAAAFAVRFGGATAAVECPRHLANVQRVIDKVSADATKRKQRMHGEQVVLVHALIEDAKMLLEAAKRNYEQPQGRYDYARAFAKADTALGHARAAEILQSRCAQE